MQIRNGSLYLDSNLYQTYFKGVQSVSLVKRHEKVFVIPVMHPGGGGLLIKILNTRGDRVIHAQGFFRDHGLLEWIDQCCPAQWNSEMVALELVVPVA